MREVGAEPLGTLGPEELAERVPGLGLAEARRDLALACRQGSLPPVTPAGLRREPYLRVRAEFRPPSSSWSPSSRARSIHSSSTALLLRMARPSRRCVYPLERAGRCVVCVSSQVGCALGCVFCGTARLGLRRNLGAWEIVDQVRQVQSAAAAGNARTRRGVPGHGRPLLNLEAVLRAARILSEPGRIWPSTRAT